MKAIMMTVRLWWFYLTYKGIKTIEIRKRFGKDFKGKIFECVSKTNWKQDLMKIPAEEREFFKQFVGKVGLSFECDKVEEHKDFGMFPYGDLRYNKATCLDEEEIEDYGFVENKGYVPLYAIHITNLEIFDKPKEISEFYLAFSYGGEKPFINTQTNSLVHKVEINGKTEYESVSHLTRAPQSWCYIEI